MTSDLRCPRCGDALRQFQAVSARPDTATAPIDAGDISLDRCHGCRATWFDSGEIVALVGKDLNDLDLVPGQPARPGACPVCGADTEGGADECSECGRSLVMPCPRCSSPLHDIVMGSHDVDACFECGGLWIEDKKVLAIAKAVWTREAEAGTIACRRCSRLGLRVDQTVMSEHGPVCEPCALVMEETDQPQNEDGTMKTIAGIADDTLTVAVALDDLFGS